MSCYNDRIATSTATMGTQQPSPVTLAAKLLCSYKVLRKWGMAAMAVLQGANNGCQVVALDVACRDNHVVSYACTKDIA